jgi:probable HAF family extracellular repeat protein
MRNHLVRTALLAGAIACREPTSLVNPATVRSIVSTGGTALYPVIDLGTLGGDRSTATDVNVAGAVVGWSQTATGATHAFLWRDGVMLDLGTLGGDYSTADAVNESGQVAGRSTLTTGEQHAFFWKEGVMYDLGPAGVDRVYLNSAEQVAWTSPVAPGVAHAFLWSDGTGRDLGTIDGSTSRVSGINDNGQVAGVSPSNSLASHAVLWTDGVMQDLGRLGGNGEVVGINARGQIAGSTLHVGPFPQDPQTRAWFWDGTQMIDLGMLPGDTNNMTIALNDLGQVAGHALNLGWEGGHPYRWQAGVMMPLSPTYRMDPQQYVVAMNAGGLVVGYRDVLMGRRFHTMVWENGTSMELTGLSDTDHRPTALNSRGDVVGWSYLATSGPHAVLWHRAVPMEIAQGNRRR